MLVKMFEPAIPAAVRCIEQTIRMRQNSLTLLKMESSPVKQGHKYFAQSLIATRYHTFEVFILVFDLFICRV
jgi:hypothetical protein